MSHRAKSPAWLLASLLAAGVGPACADVAGTLQPVVNQGPQPIATSDILLRADADERFAQDVVERSKGGDQSDAYQRQLDRLADSVTRESQLLKRDELNQLSIARLESLERHWDFFGHELDRWRRGFKTDVSQYMDDATELARRRADWEATRSAPGAPDLAPALGDRIQEVVAEIDAAEEAVSGPIDRQTALGRRANAVEATISTGQKAVGAAIAYNDVRLTRIDSPPLWRAWGEAQDTGAALRAVTRGLDIERSFLDEYRAATASYHFRTYLLGALLLPLLIVLGVRSRRVATDDPGMQASVRVLRRPVSSWVVLMMLSILVFEPEAPFLMHQAALLVVLVPVLRLLPANVYAVLGPWPYVATGLYLLQKISLVVVVNSLYYRSYLLGLGLVSIGLLGWVLRSQRPGPDPRPLHGARRWARRVGWAAIAALTVAMASNVVGNVSLAEMLTRGIIESGYVGLVLFAGVTVFASVVQLVLARKALSRFRIVTQHIGPMVQGFAKLLRIAAIAAWVIVVLSEFRIYRPIRDAVMGVLTYRIELGQISLSPGGVLLFAFSVWLAFWAARTVRFVLHDEVLPRMSLPRGVANSVSSLTYYAVVLLGLVVALAAAGFEMSQLAIVVGALGVGIGFGLQNVVNNFVSGLILMFERPIQPGDVVEVSGTSGKVRDIGMRATTLTTFEGADVVVPNGVLLNEKLINWTLNTMDRRVDVDVGVAYGTDPRKVIDLLLEVTRATPGIAADPEPVALFVGFGASSIDFSIRSWTHNFSDWVKIRSNLTLRVYDALQAAGIEIPFPQHDLHLRTVAPEIKEGIAGAGRPASG